MKTNTNKIIIFTGLIVIMLFSVQNASAQNPVGIIISGYEEKCEISSKGRLYECDDRRDLYIGDVVTKKPSVKKLKIKWAPYATGVEKSETSMEVVSNVPSKFQGNAYVGAVKQYVDDFVKPTEYRIIVAATRDLKAKTKLPYAATLIRGFPIKLSWEDEGVKSLVFLDKDNKKVFEKSIKKANSIQFTPEEVKMRPNEMYTVSLDGATLHRRLRVSLMDEALQEEILKGLSELDKAQIADIEKKIEKSSYLQLISDAYPDKIDLYWLSFQILPEDTRQLTKDQEEAIRGLKLRYYQRGKRIE